jgi:uncharacterized protein (TIGR02594 family)
MKPHEYALSQYGVSRTSELERVREYFKASDYKYSYHSNWCAIFMNWCALRAGMKTPQVPQVARNWLKVGYHIRKPKLGDIVVLWRASPTSWKGHVGFLIREDVPGDRIYLLGGNQFGGKVCIASYQRGKILGIRRLERHVVTNETH